MKCDALLSEHSQDWCTRREEVHRRVADVLDGGDPKGVPGLTPAASMAA